LPNTVVLFNIFVLTVTFEQFNACFQYKILKCTLAKVVVFVVSTYMLRLDFTPRLIFELFSEM